MRKLIAVLTALVIVAPGFAMAAEVTPASITIRNGIFTDEKGMSLYIAGSDRAANVSSCYDNCGHNWPAFNPAENDQDTGDWKIITRDDGTRQWAYKAKPVYRFILDRQAGDVKGDGIGNVWHAVRP